MAPYHKFDWHLLNIAIRQGAVVKLLTDTLGGTLMKTWSKPEVREQEVGLEVTSYLPAEIDVI
jgi:coenzyme PQQ precursor peptide PqqA